jgi:hypothetical protein
MPESDDLFSTFGPVGSRIYGRDRASRFVWQPAVQEATLRLSTPVVHPLEPSRSGGGMWLETRVRVRFLGLLVVLVACRPPGYGKGDHTDPDAAADSSTTADAAIDGTSGATCDKAFRLDGHGSASSAWLTGDFVMWGGDPVHGAIALVLGADGGWTGSHTFGAGPHQYKFIVNGTDWINDPTNPDQVDDGFGGKNSLYTCVP